MSKAAPDHNRLAISAPLVLATMMNTLDQTIANVALPHIQGSLSAAADEAVWVLTSYILASAMVTPLSGWLANRLGLKTTMLVAIGGFTVCSGLCGLAMTLPQLVLCRFAQGAFGAMTLPVSQTVFYNIFAPHEQPRAVALWSIGGLLGPLLGPILGGWLTDTYSWRWCFLINLPLGAAALLGVWLTLPSQRVARSRPFDFMGFAALIIAIGGLQMLLDRGPGQDWFASREVWLYALLAAGAFWVFLAHTLTTRTPFIDLAVFRDRNLINATLLTFVIMAVMFAAMGLLPIVVQSLMGYPVMLSGLVNAPRGLAMVLAMALAPVLIARCDPRTLLLAGIGASSIGLWQMSHFDLAMGTGPLLIAAVWQGLGQGLIMVQLSTLAFSTLAPELRPEAASIYNLARSFGSSVGISSFQAAAVFNTQQMHASLAARVTPSDPVFRWALPDAFSPATTAGAQALDAVISRQAAMVAYVNDFHLMLLLTLGCAPLVLLMRPGRRSAAALQEAMAD